MRGFLKQFGLSRRSEVFGAEKGRDFTRQLGRSHRRTDFPDEEGAEILMHMCCCLALSESHRFPR